MDQVAKLKCVFLTSTSALVYLNVMITYLLTAWSRFLLEKLTGFQLVKKFLAFYATRRLITTFTSAHHLSLSWASSIQTMSPHPISWISILILCTKSHVPFPLLRSYQIISPGLRLSVWTFHNIRFYGEGLLAHRSTPKLEDHALSAVRDCFFITFAATLQIGGCLLHPQPQNVPCHGDGPTYRGSCNGNCRNYLYPCKLKVQVIVFLYAEW